MSLIHTFLVNPSNHAVASPVAPPGGLCRPRGLHRSPRRSWPTYVLLNSIHRVAAPPYSSKHRQVPVPAARARSVAWRVGDLRRRIHRNCAGWGGASSSRRHHALLTHSPVRNRHDAFHAAGTTTADPDDARTLLAVQKPTVAPGDDYSAVVEFTTGPNLFEYDFNVVCYEQDVAVPTDSCGAVAAAVAAGDLSPLGSERGTLPRSRSGVAVTVTGLPQNADVDCFVEVGGGPIGFVSYCQYAGLTTTTPLNAPTVSAAAPGSSPGTIDVTASSPTGAQANVDAELKVACVPNAATPPDCPAAGDGAWVDATSGSAQTIGNLVAGDEYLCFAAEFSTTTGTYRVCSAGTAATASAGPPGTTLFVANFVSSSVTGGHRRCRWFADGRHVNQRRSPVWHRHQRDHCVRDECRRQFSHSVHHRWHVADGLRRNANNRHPQLQCSQWHRHQRDHCVRGEFRRQFSHSVHHRWHGADGLRNNDGNRQPQLQ